MLGCCEDRKPKFLVPQMPLCYPEVVLGCHFASASGRAHSCATSQEVLEPVFPLHLGGPAGGLTLPLLPALHSKVGRVGGGGWSVEMSVGATACACCPQSLLWWWAWIQACVSSWEVNSGLFPWTVPRG